MKLTIVLYLCLILINCLTFQKRFQSLSTGLYDFKTAQRNVFELGGKKIMCEIEAEREGER